MSLCRDGAVTGTRIRHGSWEIGSRALSFS